MPPPPPPALIRLLRIHCRRFFLRPYSSSSSSSSSTSWRPQERAANGARPKWNSNQNLVITHPVLSLMESCDSMDHLKQLHAHMTRTGLMSHRFPASRVLAFCALSDRGDMSHAASVFAHFPEPNTYMWNTMIRGYARAGSLVAAASCFRRMLRERAEMDNRTLVFALKFCERFVEVSAGEGVHGAAIKLAFEPDLLVGNGLSHFYVARGLLVAARKVFDAACQRDVVSWTTIIDGYTQNDSPDEALRLFYRMLSGGFEPNEVTMITMLSAVSQLGMLRLGTLMHDYIKCSSVNVNINLLNALISMYGKCGCIQTAEQVFKSMEVKDVFSWTSMINVYAKCDDLDSARHVFDAMPERNAVSWSCMIAAYSQASCPKEAISLFHEMIAGTMRPIDATLVAVLSACAQSGYLDLGRQIHNHFVDGSELRVNMANAFIDMYAKCGDITTAASLFNQMMEKDIVTWNTMILAYAIHGYSKEALVLFEQMKELRFVPDEITFVGVLSACSHGGLVAEGRRHFEDMKCLFNLTPKAIHVACLIDLLGKAGLMEDAYKLVRSMPIELDEAGWGALLHASRMHGNLSVGTLAGEKLLDLDPDDSGIYVLISNMCASNNKWDNVKKVRKLMRDRGIKKNPGCSLIEVDGKFHEFFAADTSHIHSEEIYLILDAIYLQLKMEVYGAKAE